MLRRDPSPLQLLIYGSDLAEAGAACLEDARMALSLITLWSVHTGKTLPPIPIEQLSVRQLEDFWADDTMSGH